MVVTVLSDNGLPVVGPLLSPRVVADTLSARRAVGSFILPVSFHS